MILVLLLCSQFLTGCVNTAKKSEGKLRIVTTFLVMYIFTKNVAGDTAEIENLVPPGAGVHDYQFTPSDVKNVSQADIVIINGLGAEKWLYSLLKSESIQDTEIVDTSRGVSTLNASGDTAVQSTSETDSNTGLETDPGDADIHIWLDPIRVKKQVENIRDGLSDIDPANAEVYKKNASEFIEKIEKLDSDIKSEVAEFKTKEFIAYHSAFVYFNNRYSLDQIAAIEPFPGKQPSPKHLTDIAELVEEKDIDVMFTEPQYSSKIVNSLADDLDVKVEILDPIETGKLEPGYWETVMRNNLATLSEALK